jgi:hypothetical protein
MSCLVDGNSLARAAPVAAILVASPLPAQTDSVATWPIGSRVRVWTMSDRKFVGYLREVRGDTLLLIAPGASRVQRKMLADSTVRLEVSEGRSVSPWHVAAGAFGGAALAIGAVALFSQLLSGEVACTTGGSCASGENYGDAALYGGAVGSVAGLFVLKEHWRSVRIPGRFGFVPSRRHAAITLSFAFR